MKKLLAFFLLLGVSYAQETPKVPDIVITGPTGGVSGDILVLDASETKAEHYAWEVIPKLPDGRQTLLVLPGKDKAIIASVPGTYHVICAASTAAGIDLLVYTVTVTVGGSTGDDPSKPDPPKPNPPKPEPGNLGLTDFMKQHIEQVVPSGDGQRQVEAVVYAGLYAIVAQSIKDGELTDIPSIIARQTKLNDATEKSLGERAQYWNAAFGEGSAYAKKLESLASQGKLGTTSDVAKAWLEISAGLGKVGR